jgi:hypothetical protein
MAMMITNISGAAISLPYPYYGVLGPGHGIVFADTEANIVANLGGAEVIDGLFKLTAVPGAGINPISTQQNPPVNVAQITGQLPISQTDGNLPTTRLSGILTASQIVSQADATYWVDTVAGLDTNPGTALLPFKTIGKATALIPHVLSHNFTINIKAGTYVESIEITTHIQSSNIVLKIAGQDWAAITPATGVQTGTFTSVSGKFATMTGAGWTVNDLQKKFVKLTSGAQSGKYFPIASNTIDTLEICAPNSFITAFNGCTFELVMPAAIIQPSGTPNGDPIRLKISDQRVRLASIRGIEINALQLIGYTVQAGCTGVITAYGMAKIYVINCYLQSRSSGTKTIEFYLMKGSTATISYSVHDSAVNANSGMNFGGGVIADVSGCFIQPGLGQRSLPFNNSGSYVSFSNGTVIENFDAVGFPVFDLVYGGNAFLNFNDVVLRNNSTIFRTGNQGFGLAFSVTTISGCKGVAFDLSLWGSVQSGARGHNTLVLAAGTKIIDGLSDAIRITCPYNSISIGASVDISNNAGWGVNLAYPLPGNALGGAFNNVGVAASATMGTNTLGDFSIDGTTALSLAALRALPGKVATDVNFFNRIFSE